MNRACSAVRNPDSLRLAQLTLAGVAAARLVDVDISGSAENSLSTEVSPNVVVLDP